MQLINFIKVAIVATLLFSATVGCSSQKVSKKETTKLGALAIDSQEPPKNNPTALTESNNFISFNGNNLAASGSCPDSGVAMLAADDETVMVLFNNIPPDGTTSVNADFFTKECSSCFGISVQDINASLTYVATVGTFTKNGNEISFTITVKELSSLLESTGNSFPVTGKFTCEE